MAWMLLNTAKDYDFNRFGQKYFIWGFADRDCAQQCAAIFKQMRASTDKDHQVFQQLLNLREPLDYSVTYTTF